MSKSPTRQVPQQVSKSTTHQVALPKTEQIQTFMQFADSVFEVGELPSLTRWLADLLIRIGKDATIDNNARQKLNKVAAELFKMQRPMRPPQTPGT